MRFIRYKVYAYGNNDIDTNKRLYKEHYQNEDWIEDTVSCIAENGYGIFISNESSKTMSILPIFVNDYKLSQNDEIDVLTGRERLGQKNIIKR